MAYRGGLLVSVPVPVLKDEIQEHPVPSEWRPKLREIVAAIKDGNFGLYGLERVEPLDEATAAGISHNIEAYGCSLTALPDDSWNTSVCQWQLEYWEVLVDLFTVEEVRCDLVLHVNIFEDAGSFTFRVHFVYVP